MLKFNKVNFSYDNQKVLEQFDLKLFDRKINCIIGPSAVGKSTLLNLIARTIEPQLGIINNSYHEVSYLFQEERLIDEITVYKNLDLILKSVYIDPLKRKYLITNGLKDVGLENTIDLFPNQLSGSMKRRLALLRSFLYPSKLLLVDEPFTGLDINVKRNIINLFLRLWKKDKRTVVFVSHDLDEALTVGSYIHVMSNKPMHLMKTIPVNQDHSSRTLYDKKIIQIKKQIIQLTKQW